MFQSVFLRSTPPSPGESKLPSRESFPEPLLTGQRAVIGGEALNATFGPATSPPTNSATSNDAASKLPPNHSEKTNVGFAVHHFPRQLPMYEAVPALPLIVRMSKSA